MTRFGQWQPIPGRQPLRGGNGAVWVCQNSAGDRAAVKVLRSDARFGSERYRRFVDEIEFLRSAVAQRKGVIRLLDAHLPNRDKRERSPWFAMPVGEDIEAALREKRNAHTVVPVIATFAETLAELQVFGVFHRDLKPANLLRVDSEWVLADFGLVAYPEKEGITPADHGVGSRHYIAPEIEVGAPNPDLGRADVYSLAKTLWVLISGQRYPYAGPHHVSEPVYNLSDQLHDSRLRPLDFLIEAATSIDPSGRPSMADFAADLRAFARGPSHGAPTPDARLQEIQQRILDRTRMADAQRDLIRERSERSRLHLYRLRDSALRPAYSAMLRAVGGAGGDSGREIEDLNVTTEVFDRWGFGDRYGQERFGLVSGIRGRIARIAVMGGYEIEQDGRSRMTAALVVEVPAQEHAIVWHETAVFTPGTASADELVERLVVGVNDNLAATLERWDAALDRAERKARAGSGDTSAPTLLVLKVEGSPLTLSGSGGVITFRAHIADEVAGMADDRYTSSPSQLRCASPSGTQFIDALFQPGRNLADGDSYDGTYVAHVRIPAQFESGDWRVQYVQLVDQVGNSVVHERGILEHLGYDTGFTIA